MRKIDSLNKIISKLTDEKHLAREKDSISECLDIISEHLDGLSTGGDSTGGAIASKSNTFDIPLSCDFSNNGSQAMPEGVTVDDIIRRIQNGETVRLIIDAVISDILHIQLTAYCSMAFDASASTYGEGPETVAGVMFFTEPFMCLVEECYRVAIVNFEKSDDGSEEVCWEVNDFKDYLEKNTSGK